VATHVKFTVEITLEELLALALLSAWTIRFFSQ